MLGAAWDDATAHLDGARPRGRRHARRRSCARGDLRGRPAQPAAPARHPGQRRLRRARRSTPPAGTTPSTSRGKRVALIGAGASGFQIAPTIAEDVEHLTVFQRTAQWMFPNPNYHDAVGPGRAVGAAAPAVLRPLVPLPALLAGLRRGPRRGRASTRTTRDQQTGGQRDQRRSPGRCSPTGSRSQVGDDPELLAKVVPDYPATGKRTLQDNGSWLRTLTRDDVELVRDRHRPHRARRGRHRRRRAPSRST